LLVLDLVNPPPATEDDIGILRATLADLGGGAIVLPATNLSISTIIRPPRWPT